MNETDFEWDEIKDLINQRKHGVSFDEAQYAFLDKNRVIAKNLTIVRMNNDITALV